jgi:transcriptional regulator with XRE-family HTH domain
MSDHDLLGAWLKDRRAKLDPVALGFSAQRRRTPGLRREEVAQRAHISAAWYTWLEQGRGGAPSTDVLDRIAGALMLTSVEREHLFLLAFGRPPEVHYEGSEDITPRLQRVLDALNPSPAIIRTATWDIVGWNHAATVLLTDYGALPREQRNVLRLMFLDPRSRAIQYDWESVARFVVGAFRIDVSRSGAASAVSALVDELCDKSPEFERMWRDNDVQAHREGVKHIRHPVLGPFSFEYSAFAVDGRQDLSMVVYNPATPDDEKKLESLLVTPSEAEVQSDV